MADAATPPVPPVDSSADPALLADVWTWTLASGVRLGILLLAIPVVILLSRALDRWATRRFSAQAGLLLGRGLRYGGLLIIVLAALWEFGFHITPALGALGVVGIAVGLASQTSLGNVISGFFLLSDRAVAIGDLVRIDGQMGTVDSIDLLSVKIRTIDNQLIRVPNESLLKMNLTTVNKFPIRRLDLAISVAYKEDVARVRALLLEVADQEPLCLDEPAPLVIFQNFGESGLEFLFAIWVLRDDVLALRNRIMDAVKARFDAEGIEIPFPHRSLYAGEASQPFPVRVVADDR